MAPSAQASRLLQRYERLVSHRRLWEVLWQEVAEFLLPNKSDITLRRSPGQKKTERLFDSTGIEANQTLAASLHGTLTSEAIRWFSLKMRQEPLNRLPEVAAWLEECARRMYLAFNQSNFSSQIHEVYLDLGCFGTACLFVDEQPLRAAGFNGFHFRSIPLGDFVIEENAQGRVDVVGRLFQLPARVAVERWPETIGARVKQAVEMKPDQMFRFLHIVLPRSDPQAGSVSHPFYSAYLSLEDRVLLDEGGYEEMPYLVPRWSVASGEIYGRGPGLTALPDLKTLNKAVELKLRSWAKVLDPPLLARDDGVLGPIRLQPAAITYVRDLEAIRPLESGARFDVSALEEERIREAIRRTFFYDYMRLVQRDRMTATEIQVRFNLMQRLLGPTLGRLEAELLNPLIERSFGLMFRAGALPPVPAILTRHPAEIDIEYEGPLARAQRMQEVEALERFYLFLQPLIQTAPEVLDVINPDEVARQAAFAIGVPQSVLRDPDEVSELRQNRVALLQAQTTLAAMQQAAKVAKDVSPLAKTLRDQGVTLSDQGVTVNGTPETLRP